VNHFLANDPAKRILQGLASAGNVLSQRFVDEGLLVAAAGFIHGRLAQTSLFEVCDAPQGHCKERRAAIAPILDRSLRETADPKLQGSAPAPPAPKVRAKKSSHGVRSSAHVNNSKII